MIETYFNDTITHLVAGTPDQWGVVAYTEVSRRCRIEYKTRLVRNQQGEQVVSNVRVFFASDVTVTHADKFNLDGADRSILRIDKPSSFATQYVQMDLQ